MQKKNVAEVGRTACAYCGWPSVLIVGDKPVCKDHIKLVKEGASDVPLKDAAPSLIDKWGANGQ